MTLENAFWLVERLSVPASLHDVNGAFLCVNEGGAAASGFSWAQLQGKSYLDLLPDGARENVRALYRRAVETGEPTDFATAFVDATGQVRSTRAQHLPVIEDGEVIGVLILAFDLAAPPFDRGGLPRLTARQQEVITLIASGLSTSETARRLSLSTETVRNHLRGAYRELGAHTRIEAIAVAQRLGLLAARPLGPSKPPET